MQALASGQVRGAGPDQPALAGVRPGRRRAIRRWPSRCCGGPSSVSRRCLDQLRAGQGAGELARARRGHSLLHGGTAIRPRPPTSLPMPWRSGAIRTSPSPCSAISTPSPGQRHDLGCLGGCSRPRGCPERRARRSKPPRSRSVRRNGSSPPPSPWLPRQSSSGAQGKHDEAIAELRTVKRLDPSRRRLARSPGSAITDTDRRSAARWIKRSPSTPTCSATRWKIRGSWTRPIAAYREAIRLRPEFAEAHSALVLALKDQGKLDEAIADLPRSDPAQARRRRGPLQSGRNPPGSRRLCRVARHDPNGARAGQQTARLALPLGKVGCRGPAAGGAGRASRRHPEGGIRPERQRRAPGPGSVCYDTRRFAAAARLSAEAWRSTPSSATTTIPADYAVHVTTPPASPSWLVSVRARTTHAPTRPPGSGSAPRPATGSAPTSGCARRNSAQMTAATPSGGPALEGVQRPGRNPRRHGPRQAPRARAKGMAIALGVVEALLKIQDAIGSNSSVTPSTPSHAGRGHRRVPRGDPAQTRIRRRPPSLGNALMLSGQAGRGHRRVSRSDPAQARLRRGHYGLGNALRDRASWTRPSPSTARRSGSSLTTPRPTAISAAS